MPGQGLGNWFEWAPMVSEPSDAEIASACSQVGWGSGLQTLIPPLGSWQNPVAIRSEVRRVGQSPDLGSTVDGWHDAPFGNEVRFSSVRGPSPPPIYGAVLPGART